MERVGAAPGFSHDLRGDDFLDARWIHLAGAATPVASLPHAPAARPAGLRHAPDELAVPSPEVQRIHLDVHMVEGGIDDRDDLWMREVRFLPKAVRDDLANLPVHLRLQRLRTRGPEVGPEDLFASGNLWVDLRADREGIELPRLELPHDKVGEVGVPCREADAKPARALLQSRLAADGSPSCLVRVSVTDLSEEAAEAGVAQRPVIQAGPM